MHRLNDALPGPHVPVRVTRGALVAHRYTYVPGRLAAEPRSTAGLLVPSQRPAGTILLTPYSMVWDWRVSRAGPMLFYWHSLLYSYYSLLLFFPFSFFLSLSWYCGAGVFGLIRCISLSLSVALPTSFIINNNKNNSLLMDWALAVSLNMSTLQRIPTPY